MMLSAGEDLARGVARYYAPVNGVVVDNADPDGSHRVRVRVPGLIDKSAWAWPITAGGGSPQRGGHIVPELGADVVVWFLGGDVERPIYAGGWWGTPTAGSEAPSDVAEVAGPDAAKVQSLELGRVKITVDEREGHRALSIQNKTTGDFITLDLESHGLHIKMTAAILLECLGVVDIDATAITLNGRLVTADSKDL